MDLKKLYIVATSLPRPGYYLVLARFQKPELCRWNARAYHAFLSARESVLQRYQGKGPLSNDYDVEGLSADQAVSRMLPLYIEVGFSSRKPPLLLNNIDHLIDVIGPAGTEREPDGLRLTLISKEPQKLTPTSELIERLGRVPSDEEMESLELRSDRQFQAAAASVSTPFTGKFKLVAIPGSARVRLSRNLRGEYVTEVPTIWS